MPRQPKIHRRGHDGQPLCGRPGFFVTENNEEVDCGSCHRVMWRSWGVEPPDHVSRNLGGGGTHRRRPRRFSKEKKAIVEFLDRLSTESDLRLHPKFQGWTPGQVIRYVRAAIVDGVMEQR